MTDNTGATTTYGYDADDRLLEESGPSGSISYAYDPVGNRTSKTKGSTVTSSVYDLDDRNTAYTYDADGNVLDDGTNHCWYDEANELVGSAATGAASPTTTYSYNGDGIRVQQASSTSTTNYVIDSSLPYASVAEDHDGSNGLAARYVYGDDLVRMDRTSGEYYYIYDGLGSARQLVNASGTVTDTYSYDAFGDLTSSPQPTPNPFLFNGQDMDGATGLIYLRARYMNPEDGRFLSQDSYEGSGEDPISLHRYLYAGDDPVIMDDPSGNAKVEVRFYFAGDPSPDKNYYAGRNSHGFVEITDIDKKKTKWYARGGPISSQYPLIFPIEAQVGLYSPRTYDWSTRPLPDVVLTNDSLPAKYYIDKLAVEAFKINSAKIKYSLLRNSNTVCHDLVRTLGFKMQPPPGVIAPGWNTNLWGGWVVQNILGPASPIGIAATAEVMALGDFDEGDE